MKQTWTRLFVATMTIMCTAASSVAQTSQDALKKGFENPPSEARPRVWWHWMNGNITQEGIELDLEWMHRVGIAGFQNFDAALQTPQVVDKRLVYMTPEWKDAFKYAIGLGDKFGMEMAIAGSPGWSETEWAVGNTGARNEEVCLDRDYLGWRKAIYRQDCSSSRARRALSRISAFANSSGHPPHIDGQSL